MKVFETGGFGGIHSATYYAYLGLANTYELPTGEVNNALFPFQFPIQYALAVKSGHIDNPLNEPALIADLQVLRHAAKRPILITIDEAAVLAKSDLLLQKLRNILLTANGYMVILAGTPDLLKAFDLVFSPLNRMFKPIVLGPFKTAVETELLIKRPLEKIGLNADELFEWTLAQEVDEIHELTGGRPYEIQLLCHVLFRRVHEKRRPRSLTV